MLLIMKISEDQLIEVSSFPNNMAVRVVKFSSGGYKIRKIFAQESTCFYITLLLKLGQNKKDQNFLAAPFF